jgi:hypothetical protein
VLKTNTDSSGKRVSVSVPAFGTVTLEQCCRYTGTVLPLHWDSLPFHWNSGTVTLEQWYRYIGTVLPLNWNSGTVTLEQCCRYIGTVPYRLRYTDNFLHLYVDLKHITKKRVIYIL